MRIIDAHAHIGSWHTLEESKRNLIHGMDRHGISASLVSNADCSTYSGHPEIRVISAWEGLKEVLDFAKENPGRIYAATWITPTREPVPSKELLSLINDNRGLVKALKLHPYCERVAPDDSIMEPYYDLARQLNLPILCHTAVDEKSSIGHFVNAAKAHPDLIFVAAHLELCSDHEYALSQLVGVPNAFTDTAWVDLPFALKAMDLLGDDHVMFGTDAPIDGEATLENPMYLEYLENNGLLYSERGRLLLRENAFAVYSL